MPEWVAVVVGPFFCSDIFLSVEDCGSKHLETNYFLQLEKIEAGRDSTMPS